jgi:hypothetical protein
MYVKIICPQCDESSYHDMEIGAFESTSFKSTEAAFRYTIDNIDVTDSLTEDELVKIISNWISKNKLKGLPTPELNKIITESFGISAIYASEMAEKVELKKGCKRKENTQS